MKSFIKNWILNRYTLLFTIDLTIMIGISVINNPYLNAVVLFIFLIGNLCAFDYLHGDAKLTEGEKNIKWWLEKLLK